MLQRGKFTTKPLGIENISSFLYKLDKAYKSKIPTGIHAKRYRNSP